MSQFEMGHIVRITTKPEWGPGKVVHISGSTVHIIFRDLEEPMAKKINKDSPALQLAERQSDDILDNLPPLFEKNGAWALPGKRLSLESLKRAFLHEFPAGFADPHYFQNERDYKLDLHIKFKKILGTHQIRTLITAEEWRELGDKAVDAMKKVNLIGLYEHAAFNDAMQNEGAVGDFFSKLLVALDSENVTKESVAPFLDAVLALPAERGRVATWPVATAFLYLADPVRFMFLKPEVTKQAAATFQFDLRYDATPNWTTYDALLRMGRVYLQLLEPMGARDFVDVQSFIYVTCGGYEASRARKALKKANTGKR